MTTLPDIVFKRYGVVIKIIRCHFVKDTCLIGKRYVFFNQIVLKKYAVYAEAMRKKKGGDNVCLFSNVTDYSAVLLSGKVFCD